MDNKYKHEHTFHSTQRDVAVCFDIQYCRHQLLFPNQSNKTETDFMLKLLSINIKATILSLKTSVHTSCILSKAKFACFSNIEVSM